MPHRIALLGAGFTRNWGGWLASELAGELCGLVSDDADLARRLKETRNFEKVLADIRGEAGRGATENQRFQVLQRAVLDAFDGMNRMLAHQHFVFRTVGPEHWVVRFLAEFDAIYTLNQDILLELQYTPGKVRRPQIREWRESVYPGIRLPDDWLDMMPVGRLDRVLIVGEPTEVPIDSQPIYKLHGSVNWRTDDGSNILVIGDGKDKTIRESALLSNYVEQLRRHLDAGDTRLMTIGYSFGDEHINKLISGASQSKGLRTYLVNPAGLSVFDSPANALITSPSEVFNSLRLAGIMTRPLRQAFESDELAFNSLWRFMKGV